MANRDMVWRVIFVVCIFILLVTNILLIGGLARGLEKFMSYQNRRRSLPCQAIPIRFVIEEPECANTLLRSMNVTNVHIMRDVKLNSQMDGGIRSRNS